MRQTEKTIVKNPIVERIIDTMKARSISQNELIEYLGLGNGAFTRWKYDGSTSPQSLQAVIRHLFRWGWLMVVLFTAVYALGGRGFLGLLTDEASVVDAAMEYLPWALLIPVAGMAAFVYDGIFIGLLKTRGMLVASAVAMVVFFGLYFALFPVWGNHALWLALIVYLALRGLVQHLYLVESL